VQWWPEVQLNGLQCQDSLTASLVTSSTYLFLIVFKEPATLSRDNLVNRNRRQSTATSSAVDGPSRNEFDDEIPPKINGTLSFAPADENLRVVYGDNEPQPQPSRYAVKVRQSPDMPEP
jgi:hypothetical protein